MTSPDRRPQNLATVLGLIDGARKRAHQTATTLHKLAQQTGLFEGFRRTYEPLTEDVDQVAASVVPVEYRKVQANVEQLLAQVAGTWTEFYNLQLTMDTADTSAFADVVVQTRTGPVTLLERVPVTTLMFLEKRLEDLRTFVAKLPVHDQSKDWTSSDQVGVYQSAPTKTVSTKKVRMHKVTVQPTQHQPAQVDIWHDDVPVGTWTRVDYHGGVPAARYAELMARVDALLDAIKAARQRANQVIAEDRTGAERLFQYVIDGTV